VALAAVAQHTSTIRLGTGVTLLPTRDPVLVAEEFATLDVLSGGRAEIGVGRGVFEGIFRAMGRPAEQASEILEEMVGLLHRLLTEDEVTWDGTWRGPLDAVTIRPRSIQRPIPLWSGSTSGLEQAARLGLPCTWVAVLYPFEQLAETAARYRQAWSDAGRSEDSFQLGIGVHYHRRPTSQLAAGGSRRTTRSTSRRRPRSSRAASGERCNRRVPTVASRNRGASRSRNSS
jgi:alkanesulfonate monooxygenase SsuD/methylene tetrahydromethanopterin reductase-like flavin-dependent oxidoreductase (luciferase family)